ncbi:hypothetical protein NDU88_005365 [Pleurodeles waltl]|uniref:Uncharacterized protein n=1 Tax=Pleurodeles waltl TaxID=8319 RepID=A0AAV7L4D7_PLEWA|nr:hypothetical protein NDU88_005365 [Pleurodeles waltl]
MFLTSGGQEIKWLVALAPKGIIHKPSKVLCVFLCDPITRSRPHTHTITDWRRGEERTSHLPAPVCECDSGHQYTTQKPDVRACSGRRKDKPAGRRGADVHRRFLVFFAPVNRRLRCPHSLACLRQLIIKFIGESANGG